MLAKELPWLEYEWFAATNGKTDRIPDSQVAHTWNTKANSNYGTYEDVFDKDQVLLHSAQEFTDPGVEYLFSPGERGCAHSHYRCWERAAASDGPILILEDDLQVCFEHPEHPKGAVSNGTTFTARLELGMQEAKRREIDVLYLGWSGWKDGNNKWGKPTRGRKNPIVRKVEYVWTTVAYVIWPRGARRLLKRAKPMDQPVDNFMAWECREGRLEGYVLLDPADTDYTFTGGVARQTDFRNDTDIKKSDGGDQGHDPTCYLVSVQGKKK
jgi:GR25 family glycosyltransferase involved in LPS biosynthesis